MHSVARKGLLGLLLASLLLATGCFSSFALTRKVYDINKDVSTNEWVQEGVFLVFLFVPVYSIATFVDAIILNSIEFWTGDNPLGGDDMMDGKAGEPLPQG